MSIVLGNITVVLLLLALYIAIGWMTCLSLEHFDQFEDEDTPIIVMFWPVWIVVKAIIRIFKLIKKERRY